MIRLQSSVALNQNFPGVPSATIESAGKPSCVSADMKSPSKVLKSSPWARHLILFVMLLQAPRPGDWTNFECLIGVAKNQKLTYFNPVEQTNPRPVGLVSLGLSLPERDSASETCSQERCAPIRTAIRAQSNGQHRVMLSRGRERHGVTSSGSDRALFGKWRYRNWALCGDANFHFQATAVAIAGADAATMDHRDSLRN